MTQLATQSMTMTELNTARAMVSQGDLVGMYDYVESFGHRYAAVAKGVVTGETLTGHMAMEFMREAAQQQGRELTESDMNDIKASMAKSFLDTLQGSANPDSGIIDYELPPTAIIDLHNQALRENQLPPDAWTLYTPFQMMEGDMRNGFWGLMLEAESNPALGAGSSSALVMYMLTQADSLDEEKAAQAREWLQRLEPMDAFSEWISGETYDPSQEGGSPEAPQSPGGGSGDPSGGGDPGGGGGTAPPPPSDQPGGIPPGGGGSGDGDGGTGGVTLPYGRAPDLPPAPRDPLVLDLDGDGLELTDVATSRAYFDMDGDLFSERVGWVAGDDGLLVRDLDGNGRIDRMAELFGNDTTSGFAVLAGLDSHGDGVIDTQDAGFADLRVWRDANQNGISESSELHTLEALEIQSLSLSSTAASQVINNNEVTALGHFTRSDGSSGSMGDAHFQINQRDSRYIGAVNLDLETLFLPKLRGYGQVADLHIAMSLDPELKELVKQFTTTGLEQRSHFPALVDAILLRWAGTDTIAFNSRGGNFDARKLTALERFYAQPFRQAGSPNPGNNAVGELTQAWAQFRDIYLSRLVMQGPAAMLFPHAVVNLYFDTIRQEEPLSALITRLVGTVPEAMDEAIAYLHILKPCFELAGLSEEQILEPIAQARGISFIAIQGALLCGSHSADTLTVTVGSTLLGFSGDDTLKGSSQGDILWGGAGRDILNGGSGGDVYVFSAENGEDLIQEYDATTGNQDLIRMVGVAAAEVTYHRLFDTEGKLSSDLILKIAGTTDQLTVWNYYLKSDFKVEEVRFDDGTVWSSAQMDAVTFLPMGVTAYGTAGSDTFDLRHSANSTVHGADSGDSGNDTYIFGVGGGQDVIRDSDTAVGNMDTLKVVGVASGDLILQRLFNASGSLGTDLVIKIVDSTDQVTVQNYFSGNSYKMECVQFDDGTQWTSAQLDASTLFPTGSMAYCTSGSDTIDLRHSVNSKVYGGASGTSESGNDTYLFGTGSGQDTVQDYGAATGNSDTLRIEGDVASDELWFRHEGNNLELSILGTGDKVTIHGWYSGDNYKLEQIETSAGEVLIQSQLEQLVAAMAAFAPPAPGQTSLTDEQRTALEPVLAAVWRHAA